MPQCISKSDNIKTIVVSNCANIYISNIEFQIFTYSNNQSLIYVYGRAILGSFGSRGGGGGGRGGPSKVKDCVHPLQVRLEDLYNGTVKKLAVNKNIICEKCSGKLQRCSWVLIFVFPTSPSGSSKIHW